MRLAVTVSALGLSLVALSGAHEALQARQGAPAPAAAPAARATVAGGGSVSTGPATSANSRPVMGVPAACPQPANVQPDVFPVTVGTVTSDDGRQWTMPAAVNDKGPIAVDLYNNCMGTGDNPNWASQLKTVVIDEDGVEITGFIFADNYFELWVNGRFVARDSIPMTPFNSSVVRFKARYPMTYAIMGVDWETHEGVGLEYAAYNVGDAGFIAYFSDGNGTRADWRAETFYIAPLDDPSCVRITPAGRDSTFCTQGVRATCSQKNEASTCKALHYPIPADWTAPRFNDSSWPMGIVWRAEAVTGAAAYTDYTKIFGDAEFIWTRNLRLDNLVLARYTAKGPRRR
ncbi:MAG: hypothetical protein HW394_1947 [Acidobacteria bacterium]|nr:hypothetical protein [Acidobacteriota bacterium]